MILKTKNGSLDEPEQFMQTSTDKSEVEDSNFDRDDATYTRYVESFKKHPVYPKNYIEVAFPENEKERILRRVTQRNEIISKLCHKYARSQYNFIFELIQNEPNLYDLNWGCAFATFLHICLMSYLLHYKIKIPTINHKVFHFRTVSDLFISKNRPKKTLKDDLLLFVNNWLLKSNIVNAPSVFLSSSECHVIRSSLILNIDGEDFAHEIAVCWEYTRKNNMKPQILILDNLDPDQYLHYKCHNIHELIIEIIQEYLTLKKPDFVDFDYKKIDLNTLHQFNSEIGSYECVSATYRSLIYLSLFEDHLFFQKMHIEDQENGNWELVGSKSRKIFIHHLRAFTYHMNRMILWFYNCPLIWPTPSQSTPTPSRPICLLEGCNEIGTESIASLLLYPNYDDDLTVELNQKTTSLLLFSLYRGNQKLKYTGAKKSAFIRLYFQFEGPEAFTMFKTQSPEQTCLVMCPMVIK